MTNARPSDYHTFDVDQWESALAGNLGVQQAIIEWGRALLGGQAEMVIDQRQCALENVLAAPAVLQPVPEVKRYVKKTRAGRPAPVSASQRAPRVPKANVITAPRPELTRTMAPIAPWEPERLRRRREDAGLSQNELGRGAGLSGTVVRRSEKLPPDSQWKVPARLVLQDYLESYVPPVAPLVPSALAERRRAASLSQIQLAKLVPCAKSVVSAIEKLPDGSNALSLMRGKVLAALERYATAPRPELVQRKCAQCYAILDPDVPGKQRFCSQKCKRRAGYVNKGTMPCLDTRVWERIERGAPDDCWRWTGQTGTAGIPFAGDGQGHRVHTKRLLWAMCFTTPIDVGIAVLHTCKHEWCLNPFHLYRARRAGRRTTPMSEPAPRIVYLPAPA